VGVIFIGVIANGMTLLNFDIYTQRGTGSIMFLAVLISSYRQGQGMLEMAGR
jgi:ribose/xylose/arabinose/galactoside ABC-type transport system permease subunit